MTPHESWAPVEPAWGRPIQRAPAGGPAPAAAPAGQPTGGTVPVRTARPVPAPEAGQASGVPSVPVAGASVPAAESTWRAVVAAQAALDRMNFSCGCLDGVLGPRTRLAFQAWRRAEGLAGGAEPDEDSILALGRESDGFTNHVVRAEELAGLAPLPWTWLEKSKAARLSHETVQEYLAERYHVAEETLRKLNPDLAWPDPPAGTVVVVPRTRPARRVKAVRLVISLSGRTVSAFDADGRQVAGFPCSVAGDVQKRPTGECRVANCAANPEFTVDPAVFAEDEELQRLGRKLVLPPGQNSPVGVAWIGLNLPGYGLHGTPHPEEIGRTHSHGCFRLQNWNAEKLLGMIAIGMPVSIEP